MEKISWKELKKILMKKNIDIDCSNEYLHISWKALRKILLEEKLI